MASDAKPVQFSVTAPISAAPAPKAPAVFAPDGKSLPPVGNTAKGADRRPGVATRPGAAALDAAALAEILNKHLNESGQPNLYRVDPQSEAMIQEVNPANGAVIAEFSAHEFPALARSVGVSGALLDTSA